MQVPGAVDLGAEDLLDTVPGLLGERCVREHASGVDDAAKRRAAAANRAEDARHIGGAGDVALIHDDLDAVGETGLERDELGVRQLPAADNRDVPCTLVDELLQGHDAEGAEAAGDEIGRIGAELWRRRILHRLVTEAHDQLAGVAAAAEHAECLLDLVEPVDHGGQRREVARLHARHHLLEDALVQTIELFLGQLAQIEVVIVDVGSLAPHLVLRPDADLAELDEASARAQAAQSRRHIVLVQAVEHDIDARPSVTRRTSSLNSRVRELMT